MEMFGSASSLIPGLNQQQPAAKVSSPAAKEESSLAIPKTTQTE
jgi:hypothetical protein